VSQARTHDQACRLEHLRHARPTLGSEIAEDDDGLLTLLDRVVLDGDDEVVLRIEDAGLALEEETFFTSDLGDGTAGSEIAAEDAARITV
jgi:hypothetical protein